MILRQNGPIGLHKPPGPLTVNAIALSQPQKAKDPRILFKPDQEDKGVRFVFIRQRYGTANPEQLEVSVIISIHHAILSTEWVQLAHERTVHVAGTATKVVLDVGQGGGGEEEVYQGNRG